MSKRRRLLSTTPSRGRERRRFVAQLDFIATLRALSRSCDPGAARGRRGQVHGCQLIGHSTQGGRVHVAVLGDAHLGGRVGGGLGLFGRRGCGFLDLLCLVVLARGHLDDAQVLVDSTPFLGIPVGTSRCEVQGIASAQEDCLAAGRVHGVERVQDHDALVGLLLAVPGVHVHVEHVVLPGLSTLLALVRALGVEGTDVELGTGDHDRGVVSVDTAV